MANLEPMEAEGPRAESRNGFSAEMSGGATRRSRQSNSGGERNSFSHIPPCHASCRAQTETQMPGAKQMPNRFSSGQLLLLISMWVPSRQHLSDRYGSVREFSGVDLLRHSRMQRRLSGGTSRNGALYPAAHVVSNKLGSNFISTGNLEGTTSS